MLMERSNVPRSLVNAVMFVRQALWFTPIVMEMPLVLANIYGCFSALVDFLIGTQLCPLMSLFSFSIYKPLGKFCFGNQTSIKGVQSSQKELGQ